MFMATKKRLHVLPLHNLFICMLAAGKRHLEKSCAPVRPFYLDPARRFAKINLRLTARKMRQAFAEVP
jgi:hypothetical protein